jgi:uncharacterized membrane protein YkoI
LTKSLITAASLSLIAIAQSGMAAEPRAAKQVSAEQAMSCIKQAVAAKAGQIKELEVKVESNRTVCEVEIIAADGKKHEVYIDVAANKVLRIED